MLSAKNPINRKVRVEYNAILSINSGKKLLIVENVNTTNVSHGCFVSSRVVHAKVPLPARHIPCCKAKAKTQSKTASGDTSILIVRRPRSQEGKPRYCDVMGTSIDVWSAKGPACERTRWVVQRAPRHHSLRQSAICSDISLALGLELHL